MGEALRKLKSAAQPVTFDLDAPHLVIARSDRHAFAVHPASARCATCEPEKGARGICDAHYQASLVQARCLRALIGQVVNAACRGQMTPSDQRIYAPWLEALDQVDDNITTLTVTLEMVRWLKRQAEKEEATITPGLAQWKLALLDFLDDLLKTAELEAAVEK